MYAVYIFFQDSFPLGFKIYGLYANVWDSLVGPCLPVYMYMLFKAYGPRFIVIELRYSLWKQLP